MIKPPVFIGNQSKSGTSLLRVIVGRHPNIFGGDGFETHWFSDEIIGSWKDPTTRRQVWLRQWFEVSEADYATLQNKSTSGTDFFDRLMVFCTQREGKQRWLEKTPDNLFYYDLIRQTWPDAQFIHGLREYKDIYASWKARKTGSLKSLSVYDFVKKVRKSYRNIDHLLGKNTPFYMETKYEELVHNPRSVIKEVMNFLGEPYVDGMENYQGDSEEFERVQQIMGRESNTSRSLKRPIFTSSVDQWKHILDREEVEVIDGELGDLRERLGYS